MEYSLNNLSSSLSNQQKDAVIRIINKYCEIDDLKKLDDVMIVYYCVGNDLLNVLDLDCNESNLIEITDAILKRDTEGLKVLLDL